MYSHSPAETSALSKTINCEVNTAVGVVVLSIPDVLGALVLKGAAYVADSRDRERHIDDAAILACALTDPVADRTRMAGSDQRRIAALWKVLQNLDHRSWIATGTNSLDAILDQRLRVLSAIENMTKPWVATLFGNCLGGGLELPLACHFRLGARDGAKIGLPELHLGSVPAWGGSARLVRCIGRDRAIDMILRARTVSGPEALSLGLVTEVWPIAELKQRALDLAAELAAQPRLAVAAMLRCLVTSAGKTLQQSLSDERAAFHTTLGSPDMVEGITAFMEKRPAEFNRGVG